MNIKEVSYTNLRMYLAKHLNDIISNNGALKVLWRGHKPCVLITEKQYQQFMKLRDIQIHTSCTDRSNKAVQSSSQPKIKNTVQNKKQKTPPIFIYKSQPDLFQ